MNEDVLHLFAVHKPIKHHLGEQLQSLCGQWVLIERRPDLNEVCHLCESIYDDLQDYRRLL